ncbi:MAG TPA: hypothetical protein VEB21_10330 [Terriglobales bacterium]|nr:hypothetical protein [Terriglobales bacterium]
MLSRRALVGKLAAGVAGGAVALATGTVRPKLASARIDAGLPEPVSVDDKIDALPNTVEGAAAPELPAPWQLLHPLAAGAAVAQGWKVADLSGALDGSCVLTLENDRGRTSRIHLCRNDGQPQGLAHTKQFDLLVMNGGQGDLPTEEGLAQAVAKLAEVVAANESGGEPAQLAAALLPHAERLRLFASAEGANARLR